MVAHWRAVGGAVHSLVLVNLLGCGEEPGTRAADGPPGPAVIAVDSFSIPLDNAYTIGHARPLAFDPYDGSIYISDTIYKQVVRIDRTGEIVAVYGAPGPGPAEFRFNGLAFVPDDSTVLVIDEITQRIQFFDRQSGEFRSEEVFFSGGETTAGLTQPVRAGEGYWFASMDPQEGLAVARWDPATGSVRRTGRVPEDYHLSRESSRPSYANAMVVGGAITGSGDALIRGWNPRNDLFIYDTAGVLIGRLDVPVIRRQGVPDDMRELLDTDPIGLTHDRLTIGSRLIYLHELPDGRVAIVHRDQNIISTDGPLPHMAGDHWLTVLSADLEDACVDARIPASPDAMPAIGFQGDSLFVLDRRIDERLNLETWIVTYQVSTDGCEWVDLE